MQKLIRYVCLASLLFLVKPVVSQVEVVDDLPPDPELHVARQHSYFGHIHSGGFGLGFRWGNIRSVERYTFQEVEFLQLRHPRAERNPGMGIIGTPRRFIFGGINQLFALRYGIGVQRTLLLARLVDSFSVASINFLPFAMALACNAHLAKSPTGAAFKWIIHFQ